MPSEPWSYRGLGIAVLLVSSTLFVLYDRYMGTADSYADLSMFSRTFHESARSAERETEAASHGGSRPTVASMLWGAPAEAPALQGAGGGQGPQPTMSSVLWTVPAEAPTLQVVDAGQDPAASRGAYEVTCRAQIPSALGNETCHLGPTAIALASGILELYSRMQRCAVACRFNCGVDHFRASFERLLVDFVSSGVVAAHGKPYADFLPELLALVPEAQVWLPAANASSGAAAHLREYRHGLVCRARGGQPAATVFHVLQCGPANSTECVAELMHAEQKALPGGAGEPPLARLEPILLRHSAYVAGHAPHDLLHRWSPDSAGSVEALEARARELQPHTTRRRELRFYIQESVASHFRPAEECFFRWYHTNASRNRMDDTFDPGMSQHFTSWWLLQRFREHPQRTYDEGRADVHVVGADLQVSKEIGVVAEHCPGRGDDATHYDRLKQLARNITALPAYRANKLFLFAADGLRCPVGGIHVFSGFIKKYIKSMVLSTENWCNKVFARGLTVPYVPHYMLDEAAWRGEGGREPGPAPVRGRNASFLFHGNFGRLGQGRFRGALLRLVAGGVPDTDFREFAFTANPKNQTRIIEHMRDSALGYLRSKFCLILPGDTATTRRLYDALAAGCVPVIIGNVQLPFHRSVDWPRVAVFRRASMQSLIRDPDLTSQWLKRLLALPELSNMSAAGQSAYRRWMSYAPGSNIVSAILRELNHAPRNPEYDTNVQ